MLNKKFIYIFSIIAAINFNLQEVNAEEATSPTPHYANLQGEAAADAMLDGGLSSEDMDEIDFGSLSENARASYMHLFPSDTSPAMIKIATIKKEIQKLQAKYVNTGDEVYLDKSKKLEILYNNIQDIKRLKVKDIIGSTKLNKEFLENKNIYSVVDNGVNLNKELTEANPTSFDPLGFKLYKGIGNAEGAIFYTPYSAHVPSKAALNGELLALPVGSVVILPKKETANLKEGYIKRSAIITKKEQLANKENEKRTIDLNAENKELRKQLKLNEIERRKIDKANKKRTIELKSEDKEVRKQLKLNEIEHRKADKANEKKTIELKAEDKETRNQLKFNEIERRKADKANEKRTIELKAEDKEIRKQLKLNEMERRKLEKAKNEYRFPKSSISSGPIARHQDNNIIRMKIMDLSKSNFALDE